jgi:hypothetical protein
MAENETNSKDELKAAAGTKGGRARAQILSPEERSEIAKLGAAARWGNVPSELTGTHPSSHPGELKVGNLAIPVFVLDDETRVISGRGFTAALGMKGRGQGMARILTHKRLKRFISSDLVMAIERPLVFRRTDGLPPTHGYDATVLVDVAEAILAARDAGALKTEQEHRYAAACDILMRSFARVGIIALIDEATGYQEMRAHDALAKILEKFVATELQKWVKTFPIDYYREMCRLRGWKFDPTTTKRGSIFGKLTNNLIYRRLAPGVLEELKRLTPRDDKGRHKQKLTQRLTMDIGIPRLREHLSAVVALMKVAPDRDWTGFMKMLDRALPKYPKRIPGQLELKGHGFDSE